MQASIFCRYLALLSEATLPKAVALMGIDGYILTRLVGGRIPDPWNTFASQVLEQKWKDPTLNQKTHDPFTLEVQDH